MSFQIKDKDGNGIAINELDRQAAEFWGKEVLAKSYAWPGDSKWGNNWFDKIGYIIHSPSTDMPYYTGWKEVKKNLLLNHIEGCILDKPELVSGLLKYNMNEGGAKPFLDLIDHWDSLGYTPHRIED